MLRISTLVFSVLALTVATGSFAGSPTLESATVETAPSAAPKSTAPMAPRLVGARYGQAAGVALVCYGMQTTPAAAGLKSRYQGDDLQAFNEEAEKVLAAWRVLHSCQKSGGPNECRLTHVWSCRDALHEIGPNGTVMAGLVEQK